MANRYLVNVSPKVWTVISMWFHVFVGGALTEYIVHHTTSVKGLLGAGIAAVVPVMYRYVNPTDSVPAPNPGLIAANDKVTNG